ncbi:hypothetical protein TNCV_4679141 [Trichonephila clavipes]|nr:hypothetical protein TNCV_4679141 [Trichonephila clavipes]
MPMASSSARSWMSDAVAAIMNRKFVRSFSERLAGSRRHRRALPRADRWWWKIRNTRLSVVRLSDHGRYVMSSSPVPLKTRRVGQRCTLNLSRAETFSRWCDVVVRRGIASPGVIHVT